MNKDNELHDNWYQKSLANVYETYVLRLFHIGFNSSNSTMKMTDVIITAARIAFGI